MDYVPNIIFSRPELREIGQLIRKQLGIKTLVFPIMKVLERLMDLYPNEFYYSISEDTEFEKGVMAVFNLPNEDDDMYHVKIRGSVYDGASRKNNARHDYLGYICHELCHFFICFYLGVIPLRAIDDDESLPSYMSMEWQAKALCGEIMIPYDRCKNMSHREIAWRTKSSRQQIDFFLEVVIKE